MATYRAFLNTTTFLVSKDRQTLGTLKPSRAIARMLFKGSLEVVKTDVNLIQDTDLLLAELIRLICY